MEEGIFYVVARTSTPQGGVYRYNITADGEISPHGFCPVPVSNWLEIAPGRKVGYATGIIDGKGVLYTLALDRFTASAPFPLDIAGSSCHLAIYPEGQRIYTANYSDSSLSELETDECGTPIRLVKTIHHQGHGVNPKRQEKAHVHQVNITPDRRFLAVVDLGLDEIISYALTPAGLDETQVIHNQIVPPGSGPRHLVFSAAGDLAYLVTELSNEIFALKYRDGRFEVIDRCRTLPENFIGESTAAAIRLSPDEKFLLATNRGHDSVAICPIDHGALGQVVNIPCGGRNPRDGNFVAGGRFFITANESGDAVAAFAYDSGNLELIDTLTLPSPLNIVPAR